MYFNRLKLVQTLMLTIVGRRPRRAGAGDVSFATPIMKTIYSAIENSINTGK
jgi:hypothetical protein